MSAEDAKRCLEMSDLLLKLAETWPAEPAKRLLLSMARDYKEQADYFATNDDVRCRPLVPVELTEEQIAREREVRATLVRLEQQWSALAAELGRTPSRQP